MASDSKVNSLFIISTANSIEHINQGITNQFTECKDAVSFLSDLWVSSSSKSIIDRFFAIEQKYANAREQAVDSAVCLLKKQISVGYDLAETENSNLADKFK